MNYVFVGGKKYIPVKAANGSCSACALNTNRPSCYEDGTHTPACSAVSIMFGSEHSSADYIMIEYTKIQQKLVFENGEARQFAEWVLSHEESHVTVWVIRINKHAQISVPVVIEVEEFSMRSAQELLFNNFVMVFTTQQACTDHIAAARKASQRYVIQSSENGAPEVVPVENARNDVPYLTTYDRIGLQSISDEIAKILAE